MGTALLLALALQPRSISAPAALPLVGAVGLVTLLLESATLLAEKLLGRRETALQVAWAVLGVLSSGPLWLGPIAARLPDLTWITDGIVAASPLTCLGVIANVDYLRTTWFYEHCSFASLRYAYPSGLPLSATYLLLGILFATASTWPRVTAPDDQR